MCYYNFIGLSLWINMEPTEFTGVSTEFIE
jgi:hypothetical protein